MTTTDALLSTVAATEARVDLLGFTFDELRAWLMDAGEPAYRSRQLADAIYHQLTPSFEQMSALPAALREQLAETATIASPQTRALVASKDGRTRKLLLALRDGRLIETVLMLYPASPEGRARATVCVSTQAGCAYGCTFCATGQMGFERHLTAGEIVAQVLYFARELRERPWFAPDGQLIDHVTNLVFMGMGEPLHNYDNTLKALRILNMPEGLRIGARHMTVSTVGLVPGILRLAEEPLQVNLAISLHAPNNAMRLRTMPVTRKYPIEQVLEAVRAYADRTGRQVTFEYVLLSGVNDADEHARELAQLLAPLKQLGHVNLIPVNQTAAGYQPPSGERIRAFRETLRAGGVTSSVRAERGDDIAAACGQLRTRETRLKSASEAQQ
ncbi:MAG TPA: 23S rRNA (adenine(2503)-C(2))-methyltransferase RlmN [Ktedonobacterales bacterium]|jgi:23S rRNA (adenine2503-C2)-methyltransferase|nr:23S rRNA (adenine(2503)-C(2))-methyltransferase RlmN [Ktedonobacterales bacterium]